MARSPRREGSGRKNIQTKPNQPGAGDLDRDAAAVLRLATLLVGGSVLAGLAARALAGATPDGATVTGLVLLVVCAITQVLVRRKHLKLASHLFITTAWLAVGAISISRGGQYSGTVGLYLLCTVLAGVLLSARAAVISCALSVPAVLALLVAETRGWMPMGLRAPPAQRGLTAVLTLVVTTAIFLIALRRLIRAAERTRRSSEELAAANRELLQSHATLEQTVAERTQSLVLARDQALMAARARMSFLANMSHELRTPMHAVVGITELLRLRGLDAETHELVDTIGKSGDALVAILDDVLDLAKIEAGRLVVEAAVYQPRGVVDELIALLGAQARGKGVRLSARVHDEVPAHVLGDRTRVRQVLMNLAGNALKFTTAGTVELEVLRGPDELLRFEVHDTGVGVTDEELGRLFQPFIQGDASTSRRYGGTGLGLAISKQLAELMGGAVGARSVPDKGSTFWFTVRAPAKTDPVAVQAPVPREKPVRTPLRILLAEDDGVNQLLALKMLQLLGYEADLVVNGLDALAALTRTPYDVVLMDVHMPEMDGLEAMRQVRAWARPQPWIIVISASALPEDRAAAFAAGANDCLSKPMKVDALEKALARAPR